MNETGDIVHPKTVPLQLWACEAMDVMCFKNTMMGHAEGRHSHSKREIRRKKGVMGPNQVQNLARQIPWDLKDQDNPLWFDAVPSGPIGLGITPLYPLCFRLPFRGTSVDSIWSDGPPTFETEKGTLMISKLSSELFFSCLENNTHSQWNSSVVQSCRI